jgi:hypothetical protein
MNGGGQVPYGKVLTVFGREKVYFDNTYATQGGALVIGDVDGFSAASTSPVLLALTQSGLSTSNNVSIQMGKASSNTAFLAYNFNSNTANTTFSINHFGAANQFVLRSNGNMGLGTALPGSALSFGANSGNKILTVPFLTSINPELGVGAGVVSGALGSVKNIANAVAETAGAVRSGNLRRAGQTAQGVRDANTNQAPQALRQAIQNAPALGFH